MINEMEDKMQDYITNTTINNTTHSKQTKESANDYMKDISNDTTFDPTSIHDKSRKYIEFGLDTTLLLFQNDLNQMLNFNEMSSAYTIFNSKARVNNFKSKKVEKPIENKEQYTLSLYKKEFETDTLVHQARNTERDASTALAISSRLKRKRMAPQWHAPWKLMRVISGIEGWVRALDVDYTNEWFVSGGADRQIKFWDLASGKLKLSLTGHISTIRGLKISDRHPYLFSVGEDKTVRCWDLNQNKNIKKYHGHMASVFCIDTHPTLDVIVTGGGDRVARVWDMRTQAPIWILEGHKDAVVSVACQGSEPQIITGSQDSTIRCWDMRTGKTRITLTNHKKGVRSITVHPTEYTFATTAADSIKKWQCPEARFLHNFMWSSSEHHTYNQIINTSCINQDDVFVTGSNDGFLHFWDWKTGNCFQTQKSTPQSGSLDCEASIYSCIFDRSGSRLITGEGDKTIKIWKEDENATEETHPVQFNPDREELMNY